MTGGEQKPLVDTELEAALLSLDHTKLTQNMMQELINVQGDGQSIDAATIRKHSLQGSNNDSATNRNLESLIQKLRDRKEIT